jgi:ABC-type glycerol-3-phosphate transport system substrate-binding protein
MQFLVDMQARGALQPEVLTWGELELADAFAEGRLGMLIGGPWVGQRLRATTVEWAAAPLPLEDQGTGSVQVDWLIALADTDRADNAQRFLHFMAERESQRALVMLCGAPGLRSLSEELAGTSPWSAHIPALRGGGGLPLRDWADLRARLNGALSMALSGRMTPAEALQSPDGDADAEPL